MKAFAFTIFAMLLPVGPVIAQCIGSSTLYTCNDAASGNSYNVHKFGSSTSVTGSNPNGSNWSSNTQDFGGTSFTNGTAADGSSWNSMTTDLGSGSMTSGTDSRGQAFSVYCDAYGNCN